MSLSYGLYVLFLNSTLFPSSIHAAICTFSSLLLTAAQESMVCIQPYFIYTFPWGWKPRLPPASCPHKRCHHEHLCTCALVGPGSVFLMIVAGSGIAGPQDTCKRISASIIRLLSQMAVAPCTLDEQCIRNPVSAYPQQLMASPSILILPIWLV